MTDPAPDAGVPTTAGRDGAAKPKRWFVYLIAALAALLIGFVVY